MTIAAVAPDQTLDPSGATLVRAAARIGERLCHEAW